MQCPWTFCSEYREADCVSIGEADRFESLMENAGGKPVCVLRLLLRGGDTAGAMDGLRKGGSTVLTGVREDSLLRCRSGVKMGAQGRK